jgi:hypothetical protein
MAQLFCQKEIVPERSDSLMLHNVTRNVSDFIPYDDENFGRNLTAARLAARVAGYCCER